MTGNWVSNDNFKIKEIPNFHPLSPQRQDFWMKEKRKCIDGAWAHGKFMPPKLYFYANYGTIQLNEKISSKAKTRSRPVLRDIEWEVHYNFIITRGFSGFELDEEYTCHRLVNEVKEEYDIKFIKDNYPECINPNTNELKEYVDAQAYIRRIFPFSMGKPLYQNAAKDFLWLTARGVGKSYITANIILHEWLFNGVFDYDELLARLQVSRELNEYPYAVTLIVGAADAKYTKETLSKTRDSLERLPGASFFNINGKRKYYPSPFSQKYLGGWNSGDDVSAQYKKKIAGSWQTVGSGSKIKNRSFRDNAFAGQGSRNSIVLLEEIGMFSNAIESKNAMDENTKHGSTQKFGTIMMIGTGGDMSSNGGTYDAHRMFYDPDTYDILAFNDEWEKRGRIAYFMPAYYGLNHHRDTEGRINITAATEELNKERDVRKRSKSGRQALDNLIQYHPLVPSEIFLSREGNIFPVFELKERLNKVEQLNAQSLLEKKVFLSFDSSQPSGINYRIDIQNKLTAVNDYPWKSANDKEGAVVIYDFPETDESGKTPEGLYIVCHDPYRIDSADGDSLSATLVIKTKKYFRQYGHDEIVAVYYSRPSQGRDVVNQELLKIAMYYNAKVHFENNVGNVKEYFEKMKKLSMLAKSPTTILSKKASFEQGEQTNKGISISNQHIKMEALSYVRDWLLEERGIYEERAVVEYRDKFNNVKRKTKLVQKDITGEEIDQESDNFQNKKILRNLDLIVDKKLLGELIAYNLKGNFDAVSALCVGIAGMEDTYNKHAILMEDHTKESNELDFLKFNTSQFNRDMYAHQKAQEINNKKINELQNSQNDYVDTQSLDYQFSRLGI